MGLLRCLAHAMLALMCLAASPVLAERVVAVGDLHGDYGAYLDIVEAAGVADKKGNWTGGDAVFVQLGDFTDRGPDSLKIVRHLQGLEQAAPKAGGKIVVLVGNHEAMNVSGDLRYVHPGEFAAFATRQSQALRKRAFEMNRESILADYRKSDPQMTSDAARSRWLAETPPGKIEHRQAWVPSGKLGQWIAAKPAIVLIGDTVFVHGGLSVETAARSIDAVNADVAARLAAGDMSDGSILNDSLGPLWYRGNIVRDPAPQVAEGAAPVPPRPSIEDELAQVLSAYKAKRLVVGHTPERGPIIGGHGGKLVRIDTAIASHYGGVRSYLELKDGTTTAWHKDGGGKWVSRELPTPQ